MAANIGTVEYNLRVDMSGVRSEMGRATKALEDFNGRMSAGASIMSNFVRGFSAGLLIQGIGQAIEAVAKLGDTAKLTGINLRALQDLQSAAAGSGVRGDAFTNGLEEFGRLINDARRDANSLSELFQANGVKITDNAGKQRAFNDLLLEASRLVQNAATEFDKIEIAKALGFTKDWVDFLEQGPVAIQEAINKSDELGGKLDENAVEKAKEFQRAWESAIQQWSDAFRTAVVEITSLLDNLWKKAQPILSGVSNVMQALSAQSKMSQGLPLEGSDISYLKDAQSRGKTLSPDALEAIAAFERQQRANFIASEKNVSPYARDMPASSTRIGAATVIPTKGKSGGGSSASDTADAVERYLINLEKSRDILAAEVTHWGETTVAIETAKNLEAARAAAKREGRDLTAEEEQKVKDVTAALVNQKEVLESLNSFRQTMFDIAGSIAGALDQWIVKGGKFKDVLSSLLQQLASMALQTALLGSNGKSGIFGTIISGITSGLFGGKAGGGTVSAGVPYMVGERGPEMFMPGASGTIIPNGTLAAAGAGQSVTVVQQFASGVSRSDLADLLPVLEARARAGVLDALNRGK